MLFRSAGFWIDPRCLTVRPILLHLASRNVFKRRVAKERQEVNADVIGLRFHRSGIAFAQRDDLELTGESLGGILKTGAARRSLTTTIRRWAGIGDDWLGWSVKQRDPAAVSVLLKPLV